MIEVPLVREQETAVGADVAILLVARLAINSIAFGHVWAPKSRHTRREETISTDMSNAKRRLSSQEAVGESGASIWPWRSAHCDQGPLFLLNLMIETWVRARDLQIVCSRGQLYDRAEQDKVKDWRRVTAKVWGRYRD